MKRTRYIFVATLLLIGLPAGAQSLAGQSAPVQFIVSPENPGPQSTVDIQIEGVGTFLGNSQIIWRENGSVVLQGIGEREFTFTTGKLGSQIAITASIVTNQYGTITRTFTFNPSRIDLVWEADTTVPPFYQGKARPSAGSFIHVIAFPEVTQNAARTSANALSYQWGLDGTPNPAGSGTGRNVFSFQSNQLHTSADVSVDVFAGTQAVGHGEISIGLVDPEILFYIHDPLRGNLYNRALVNSFSMPAVEETFRAEPYFFSSNSIAKGAAAYSWQLNNSPVTGPNTAEGELTLRQTNQSSGNASLSVSLQNNDSDKLLQAAQTNLFITFGARTSNASLFGL